MDNHYDRLELPVNATEQQIKMQYRRLAKRCHPDLNPNNPKAAEDFRKLHHAYTILSDPEKRQAYDAALSRPGRGYEPDPAQRYYRRASSQAYAQTRTRPTPRRHMYKPDRPRSSFLQYMLSLSIEELFKGARRRLTIGQTHTCPRCRGKGVLGNGEKCPRCDGYTFLVSYEPTEVVIPPGVLPGTMIRVEVGGDYSPTPAFDVLYIDEVLVTIGIKEDEHYSVRDQHLYTTVPVPAHLLKEGGQWKLPAPEGGELIITIPANTPDGTVLTVRRQGLRNGASHRRGHLYCTVVAEDK